MSKITKSKVDKVIIFSPIFNSILKAYSIPIKWLRNFSTNSQYLSNVTLVCGDGQQLEAHKTKQVIINVLNLSQPTSGIYEIKSCNV